MVEHAAVNRVVVGSSPTFGANPALQIVWHRRNLASLLPLRLGATGQDLRLPGTIRPGRPWAQQPGRASRLREESPRPDSGKAGFLKAAAASRR